MENGLRLIEFLGAMLGKAMYEGEHAKDNETVCTFCYISRFIPYVLQVSWSSCLYHLSFLNVLVVLTVTSMICRLLTQSCIGKGYVVMDLAAHVFLGKPRVETVAEHSCALKDTRPHLSTHLNCPPATRSNLVFLKRYEGDVAGLHLTFTITDDVLGTAREVGSIVFLGPVVSSSQSVVRIPPLSAVVE